MRKAISALLVAGAVAQPALTSTFDWSQVAPAAAPPAQPAAATFDWGSFALPAGAQAAPQAVAAVPAQVPAQAQPAGPETKGIPVGTNLGIIDSDTACKLGKKEACNQGNIAWIGNPDRNLQYQTELSDALLTNLQSTNRYDAAGNRVATGNLGLDFATTDIPFVNQAGLGQTGGVVMANPWGQTLDVKTNWQGLSRPLDQFTASASNQVLPNSAAFFQANVAPGTTTPVNTLMGAGFGYTTGLQTAQNANAVAWNQPAAWNQPVAWNQPSWVPPVATPTPVPTPPPFSYNFPQTPAFNYFQSTPAFNYNYVPAAPTYNFPNFNYPTPAAPAFNDFNYWNAPVNTPVFNTPAYTNAYGQGPVFGAVGVPPLAGQFGGQFGGW